jgi:serine phosphatase RsbU (regulator of sigma subunit)
VLHAVLEINRILGGTSDLNEVLGRALAELFSIFPQAECGFLLTRELDGKLNPRATRQREGSNTPPGLSRTVLNHVMTEGKALLISDAKTDPTFKGTDTLRGAGIRTAMCVPIPGRSGLPIGIVQIDSRSDLASFKTEDLELLAAVSIPIGVVVENHRLLRVSASLAAAAEVQAALLPQVRPSVPGYCFWEHYQPALEVGGDYYDYIPIEPPEATEADVWVRWAVAVGDVSGKGMPAALLMANLCSEVRHLVRSGAEAHIVAERVNRRVYDSGLASRFITFQLAMADASTHRLVVVDAGHTDLLIRRKNGGIESIGQAEAGMPLGVDRNATYEATTASIGVGDVVVLYTDGVTEAMNRNDEQFGVEGLKNALASAPAGAAKVGEAIIRAVRVHVGNRPQSDDIALVVFGRD